MPPSPPCPPWLLHRCRESPDKVLLKSHTIGPKEALPDHSSAVYNVQEFGAASSQARLLAASSAAQTTPDQDCPFHALLADRAIHCGTSPRLMLCH